MWFLFILFVLLCSGKESDAFYQTRGQYGQVRIKPVHASKEFDINNTIEYMQLMEAKEARFAQSLQFNQTMALQHLQMNQQHLQMNQENKKFLWLNLFRFSSAFLVAQCAIYIRDGILGKNTGELAFYSTICLIVNQFVQAVKAIRDLGTFKAIQLYFQIVLKCVISALTTIFRW